MSVARRFDMIESARLSGFQLGMLNYVCRVGIVVPLRIGSPRRGSKRYFTLSDIIFLRAIKKLLDLGVSIKRLKSGFSKVGRPYPDLSKDGAVRFLYTNGRDIVWRIDNSFLNQSNQFEFGFVLNIEEIRKSAILDFKNRKHEDKVPHQLKFRMPRRARVSPV